MLNTAVRKRRRIIATCERCSAEYQTGVYRNLGSRRLCVSCRAKAAAEARVKVETPARQCLHCKQDFIPCSTAKSNPAYGKFCSIPCKNKHKRGWDDVTEALKGKTRPSGQCIMWTGWTDRCGYGMFRVNGRMVRAHRLAYELAKGPIPSGMLVCHTCDNPPCVNPDHLFLGTHRDNSDDKWAKGRGRVLRGEDAPNARLTQSAVDEIRRRHAAGEKKALLAREFGVVRRHISTIVTGESWPLSAPHRPHETAEGGTR